MKRIFLISLILLSLITISAAAAADNITDTQQISDETQDLKIENEDVLGDGDIQKQDLNTTIDYPSEIVKEKYTKNPYQVKLKDFPFEYLRESSYFDVYVDGQFEKTMDYYSERNDIDISKLSYGNHSLLVRLNGTEKFNPANITHEFTLVESIIYLSDEANEDTGTAMHSDGSATGYFIVNVDGKQFKKVPLEIEYDLTYASVSYKGLKIGTHEIEAIYTGGNGHKRISIKKTVNITYYMDFYIDSNYSLYQGNYKNLNYSIYGKEKTELFVVLPEDVKSTPVVTIGGKNYSTVEVNVNAEADKYFKADLTFAPLGTNNVTITYPGDSKYPEKSIATTLNVIAKIEIPIYSVYKESRIILRLPEDAKGNLTIYVDGKRNKTLPMVNGKAEIIMDLPPKAGYYEITAAYEGTDYDVKNETELVNVYPKITPNEMTYGEEQIEFIEVNPDSKMNISYYKNNVLTPIHIVNGKGNFTINTDGYEYVTWENSHWMFVTLICDGMTYEKSITINPLPSKLVAKDITTYYGDAKTYSLTVWGPMGKIVGEGEKVKITIDSKSTYKYTDKNGKITFKVDMTVGTHKIAASYQDAKITTKVVVKQPLKLYSLTIKKSAKKLYLKATLKKGKTAIKNKQITFKFNGKTYKAKTNKNGLAKVTISKAVLSKLKVGKSVTYQATYLKDTVKKTAKVKK